MKVKLLKKVRKQYQIYYREEPYDYKRWTKDGLPQYDPAHYKLERRYFLQSRIDKIFDTWTLESKELAEEIIIINLRARFPKLGHYNRQRDIKETEHKVWYK